MLCVLACEPPALRKASHLCPLVHKVRVPPKLSPLLHVAVRHLRAAVAAVAASGWGLAAGPPLEGGRAT